LNKIGARPLFWLAPALFPAAAISSGRSWQTVWWRHARKWAVLDRHGGAPVKSLHLTSPSIHVARSRSGSIGQSKD